MKLGVSIPAIAWLAVICAAVQDRQAAPPVSPSQPAAPLAVVARLGKALSARKLKAGDKVTATVIQDLVLAGKVFIPREAKLVGRVVEVQAPTRTDPRSRLAILFESRKLKEGGELPMRGVLQALAPPLPDPFLEAAMSASSPYGAGQNGHPVNGGILSSGQTNVPTPVVAEHPRETAARALEQRRAALESADKPGPQATGPHGALTVGSHGVFGLPGLFLSSGAPVPAVVASGQNVELASGTQIVLRLE